MRDIEEGMRITGSWNPQLVEAVVGAVMNTGMDAGMQMAPKRKKE